MLGEIARTSCWTGFEITPSANWISNLAGPSANPSGICALICQGVTAKIAAGCEFTHIANPFKELGIGVEAAAIRASPVRLVPNALIRPPIGGYSELWLTASATASSSRGAYSGATLVPSVCADQMAPREYESNCVGPTKLRKDEATGPRVKKTREPSALNTGL